MIEEYMKELESFKHNQISKILERIDAKIFEILYSKHVSPNLISYFPRYELCFMSAETKLEPNKLYIKEEQGKIAYSVITPQGNVIQNARLDELTAPSPFKYNLAFRSDRVRPQKGSFYIRRLSTGLEYTVVDPNGKIITDIIKKETLKINLQSDFSLQDLEPLMPEILSITAKRKHTLPHVLKTLKPHILSAVGRKGHIKWAPFENYTCEPENISQIKKLINALYHARLTFLDLEQVNAKGIRPFLFGGDAQKIYNKTINSAYEASYLLTHLDVDLKSMFSEELAAILPIFNQIQKMADNHTKEQQVIAKALQPLPLAHNMGSIAGITIDQLRPLNGDMDYNFLTQFSCILPSYIDQLTQHIQKYSSQIKKSEPKLNKEKLDELKSAALHLLNNLETLKGSSAFVSLKFLNYIHIIRNIITLSMSSLEQIGELSDTSQDLVREKLAGLKYELIPTLFGLVDKIEVNMMLKQGTFSVPLMEKIKELYEAILYLPKKVVDFKIKGEELLEIENSRFVELRLEQAYTRIDEANKRLYKIRKAQEASQQFFAILNQPKYKKFHLHQLPTDVKEELTKHYKLISPYVDQLDFDLNNLLIEKIRPAKEGWRSSLERSLRWVSRQTSPDHVNAILAKKEQINNLINKGENTQLFHIQSNKYLIESIHKNTKLFLSSYIQSEQESVYSVDESIPLKLENDNHKKYRITKTDFRNIQEAYILFSDTVKKQITDQEDHIALNTINNTTRCQQLYNTFGPYLNQSTAKDLEQYLNDLFSQAQPSKKPSKELFLNLDKNIQDFFNQIHFEWSDETEFQAIRSAYTRFSQRLKDQIQIKPEFYGNNLLLTNLSEDVKKECQGLYAIFKPYFKLAISSKFKESAQNFEQYLQDLLDNNPLDILDTPPTSLFLKLDKEVCDFFTKWQDKSTAYYDFSKKTFLSKDESKQLNLKRAQDAKLCFEKQEQDKILTKRAHEQLSAEQALDMWQWYKNKETKFLVARNAYNGVNTWLSSFDSLSQEQKDKYRNYYSIFQSYLIDAVPTKDKENALKFDKELIDFFSNKSINIKDSPSVKVMTNLSTHIQDFFEKTATNWRCRADVYRELAEKKFIIENDSKQLQSTLNTHRAHYVIQHKNYSKAAQDFRTSLFAVTTLFNEAMQRELIAQSPSSSFSDKTKKPVNHVARNELLSRKQVPFIEMEDDNCRLMQSEQLRPLKEMFNGFYYLEGIISELENLNNKSFKLIYVIYLLKAYSHANKFIELSQRLATDPLLRFITQELQHKAQILYATLQEQSDAYQIAPEEVAYGSSDIQNNVLWYVLNAFYIGPKHIRALKNTNYLTTEELNDLHIHAKKSTSHIEQIIESSSSYFKLFLQTPKMISLYKELTQKLNEFTTTSHDAALDSLSNMRAAVLTPMLLEAEQFEDRLGLKPGLFSGPLRQITEEFFKGLLNPLNLASKQHISLVCDKSPLLKRTHLIQNQINDTTEYLKKLEKKYEDIEELYQHCLAYNNLKARISIAYISTNSPNLSLLEARLEESTKALRRTYHKALPRLNKLKLTKKINIKPSPYPEDHQLDALCNTGLKNYEPHFTEVEALIKASHHYYLGLKATHKMKLATAEEKLTYLKELDKNQEKEHIEFVQQYATQSFEKHLAAFYTRYIGLQYVDEEYQHELKKYLLTFKNDIIFNSKIAADVNLYIQEQLRRKTCLFETKHYAGYYHLDSVRVALDQFKNYFAYSTVSIQNNSSLFESTITLDEKNKRIHALDLITKNTELSIEQRLEKIVNEVNDPNFVRIILAHKKTNSFSFNRLIICVLSLLEALHLYTPTRKTLLNNLTHTLDNKPQIGALTKRFGLFTSNHHPLKDDTVRRYEPPIRLTTSPTA